jgi:uncharacterized protein YllA (UPF0747 family)
LSFEDVALRFEELKADWLARQDTVDIDARFAHAKRQFADIYEPLLQAVGSVQTGLSALGETNKRKIIEQIEFLEARTRDAHAKRFEAVTRQLDLVAQSLWPGTKPQERVINVSVYWNRYGRMWLDRLLEVPFDPCGGHRMIYL